MNVSFKDWISLFTPNNFRLVEADPSRGSLPTSSCCQSAPPCLTRCSTRPWRPRRTRSLSLTWSRPPFLPFSSSFTVMRSEACLSTYFYHFHEQVQIGPETVMTTLYTAKKYAVPALEKHCVDFLKRNLSPDNAFMLLTQVCDCQLLD